MKKKNKENKEKKKKKIKKVAQVETQDKFSYRCFVPDLAGFTTSTFASIGPPGKM